MSSTRYSAGFLGKQTAMGTSEKTDQETNDALWRIPEWFPHLDQIIVEKLKAYHSELLKFNSRLNLISRATERDADEVHIADCLFVAELLKQRQVGPRIFDIGSGNGLPGVLLSMVLPQTNFSLVEVDARKAEFLKHVVYSLGIKNAEVLNVRIESLTDVGVSYAISRGFATISKTILGCNRLFKGPGTIYHMKGMNWSNEIAEIPSQVISVWKPELIGEYSLPVSLAKRALVVTNKAK